MIKTISKKLRPASYFYVNDSGRFALFFLLCFLLLCIMGNSHKGFPLDLNSGGATGPVGPVLTGPLSSTPNLQILSNWTTFLRT